MTNGEIFRAAADELRANGWGQGIGSGAHAPHCVLGALLAVTGGLDKTYGDLSRAIEDRVGCLVVHWNDARSRTKEDVLALLDGLAFDEDLKAAATTTPAGKEPLQVESLVTAALLEVSE